MIKIREGYDNSHFTYEYSPLYCENCGQVFGWTRQVTQSPNSETLCHNCFENLPEPVLA